MVTGPAKVGVVGHPIAQSLSPRIHNGWMTAAGIKGDYIAIDGEERGFAETVKACQGSGYRGLNVTIPYKGEALALADCATDRANRIGAANLLVFSDDGILADNTDAEGFKTALLNAGWHPRTGTARILGAGGAAPAILFALQTLGFQRLEITNRSPSKAIILADRFDNVHIVDWFEKDSGLDQVDLLVNATSLGMVGMPSLDADLSSLPSHAAVVDIVTTPPETALLAQARRRGLFTQNGIPMLVYQAVPSFFAWFGRAPEQPAAMIDELAARAQPTDDMLVLALTGGIGMGKSATAAMFADQGVAVWDADAAVHRLYGPDGEGAARILAEFPEVDDGAGGVDRGKLSALLADNPDYWARLNTIIHPLVAADREAFLAKARKAGAKAVLCDIPLLFETGLESGFDHVIVCSAAEETRKARVLDRPDMTDEKYSAITARQMSDTEKRRKADFIVETDRGFAHSKRQVADILASIFLPKSGEGAP
ncbi:MAG: shikimate dehydrogenase [Parvularcula sp.]